MADKSKVNVNEELQVWSVVLPWASKNYNRKDAAQLALALCEACCGEAYPDVIMALSNVLRIVIEDFLKDVTEEVMSATFGKEGNVH